MHFVHPKTRADIQTAIEAVKKSDAYMFGADEPHKNAVGCTGGDGGGSKDKPAAPVIEQKPARVPIVPMWNEGDVDMRGDEKIQKEWRECMDYITALRVEMEEYNSNWSLKLNREFAASIRNMSMALCVKAAKFSRMEPKMKKL